MTDDLTAAETWLLDALHAHGQAFRSLVARGLIETTWAGVRLTATGRELFQATP
jgi:hypothetical protein